MELKGGFYFDEVFGETHAIDKSGNMECTHSVLAMEIELVVKGRETKNPAISQYTNIYIYTTIYTIYTTIYQQYPQQVRVVRVTANFY